MDRIEQALKDVADLHTRVARHPAPEIGPQSFLPFPPGVDPVAFAIEEVSQLKRAWEQHTAPNEGQPAWVPRCAAFGNERTLCFVVDLPGVQRDDLSVNAMGGELIVRGHRRPPEVEPSLQPMVMEQACGPFERRFPLPPWCNPERIRASFAGGVLDVTLDRHEEGSAGTFQVEIG